MSTGICASLPTPNGTNRYRIRVRGRVAEKWIDALESMTITTAVAPDGTYLTTLEGPLPDQAALVGILNSLYTLRLILLGVEYLPDGSMSGSSK